MNTATEQGLFKENGAQPTSGDGLRAVLVTASDGVRQAVLSAMSEAGLPIQVGLELTAT